MSHPLPDKDYKVMVVTFTYNQEKYIAKALDGILMQHTNFDFVALVLDDCSTDSTASIVREYESKYPDKIKGIYQQENYTSQGKSQEEFIHPWQLRSQYEAFCEGDDYWTDPLKLQKQVDFMDAHPDCTLSFHSVVEHWENGLYEDKIFCSIEDREYSGNEILKKWIVSTSSTMFRTDITSIPEMQKIILTPGFMYYDIVLFLTCGMYGKLMGISDVMGVYRRLENGYVRNLEESLKSSSDVAWKYVSHYEKIVEIFGRYYGSELCDISKNKCVGYLNRGAKFCFLSKNYMEAWRLIKYSCLNYFLKTLSFYCTHVCGKG